jgi:beta-lactamase class C
LAVSLWLCTFAREFESKRSAILRKKILHIFLLPLALCFSTQAMAPQWSHFAHEETPPLPSPEVLRAVAEYDAYIAGAIERGEAPGAALAVVYNGQVLLTKGYGVQSVETGRPVNERTVFRIASLSKTFAGFLSGQLVEKGVINWDDPVVQHLSDFCLLSDEQTENLQLRHLLSHTTGLPYHTYTNLIEQGLSISEIMPRLSKIALIGREGTVYSYQNVVFSLIGEVIQAATGASYEENLRREVFEPLGMRQASANLEGFMSQPDAAMPHSATRSGLWQQRKPSPSYYNAAPAGGVNASAADMAQYLLAMLGHRPDVLSPETIAQLGSPLVRTPVRWRYFSRWKQVEKASYGLGWRVADLANGERLLYHGGYVSGYRAEMAVHPEKKWGVFVVFNGAASMAGQCVPTFMSLMEGQKELL